METLVAIETITIMLEEAGARKNVDMERPRDGENQRAIQNANSDRSVTVSMN